MKKYISLSFIFIMMLMIFILKDYQQLNKLPFDIDALNVNQSSTIRGGIDVLGNRILNPSLQYTATQAQIPSWKLAASNNIGTGEITAKINSGTGDFRDISPVSGSTSLSNFKVSRFNDGKDFKMVSVGGSSNDNANAFVAVSQVVRLEVGQKYYFRVEFEGNPQTVNRGSLAVFPGTVSSGSDRLVTEAFALSGNQVIEAVFTATKEQANASIRSTLTNQTGVLIILIKCTKITFK